METDKFEAAVFYDLSVCREKKKITFPRKLLIIDTDKYAACLCAYSENGNCEKAFEYAVPGGDDCIADVNNSLFQQMGKNDILEVLGGHTDSFNSAMENYYRSEGQMDTSFKGLTGSGIKCSDMEKIFKIPEERFNSLFSALEESWEKCGFEEENTYIMLIGKSADLFPVKYLVRSYFSFDPFLADERYVNDIYGDKTSQIYEKGKKLLEEKRKKEEEVYVCVYDNLSGTTVKQKLLLCDREGSGETEYFGPVFVSVKDGLEFEVNAEKKKIALPYSVETSDCDVVDIGLQTKKGAVVIVVRRVDNPEQIYEVPMSR